MSFKLPVYALLLSVPVLFSTFTSVSAENLSFTGTFSTDDEVQLFTFTVGATSTVTLQTWSYAGGTNSAGASIAEGGFDPILALFDSTGTRVAENDDGLCSEVAASTVTGACYDTYLQQSLEPDTYTVSVMQFDNFSVGPSLGNGFERTGQPGFTAANGCSNQQFCDFLGFNRTNFWAFDILNVDSGSEVPLPAAVWLIAPAFGLLAPWVKRRRATA